VIGVIRHRCGERRDMIDEERAADVPPGYVRWRTAPA
jgi:hypothetical protein